MLRRDDRRRYVGVIILDTESYPNFWLAAFLDVDTGRIAKFSAHGSDATLSEDSARSMRALMYDRPTGSFNGLGYDLPMIALALAGATASRLHELSDEIVGTKMPAWKIAAKHGIEVPDQWDHVDVMPVAPGMCSLKMYAARLGLASIADLPYEPGTELTEEQAAEVTAYCVGDLNNTAALHAALAEQIALRVKLSADYGRDYRSTSDAGIAESVIVSEVERLGGRVTRRGKGADAARSFRMADPGIIAFASSELREILTTVLAATFEVNSQGKLRLPAGVEGRDVTIGETTYRMGIGGLHSQEKRRTLHADDDRALVDMDAASFYPAIIMQQGLAPGATGAKFQTVYKRLVERRLVAKAAGDKAVADSLKITVNAAFGKLGNRYGALYAPHLFIQVTVTGQLALLMLIERIEAAGIPVVSANTDGIVTHCPTDRLDDLEAVAWDWMLDTSFELERTDYRTLFQRDVNSYIAVKTDGTVKRKGAYAVAGLWKNPQFPIVADAVASFVSAGVPIADTVLACEDVRAFCSARRVTGGAAWRGEALGRTARWYLSTECLPDEVIEYAKNTNKVPMTDGGRPVMTLPGSMPEDVDYGRYIAMAETALKAGGWVDV